MKIIRTLLGTIGFAVAMLISRKVHAETINLATPPPAEQAFNAKEFSLSLYGTGAIETDARAKEAVQVGTGIGADYFITRGFGIGARAELSDFSHSVVDRSSGRLTARAPLWDTVAPYGYVEGGFDFERERLFAGAGGGVEARLKKIIKVNANLFGELGLETTTRGEATGRAAAGIRLPF